MNTTSGSLMRADDILSVVELGQTVVGDLQHPTSVYNAVPGRQRSVNPIRIRVQVFHPLKHEYRKCNTGDLDNRCDTFGRQ